MRNHFFETLKVKTSKMLYGEETHLASLHQKYESYGFEKYSSGATQSLEVMRNVPMINSEMILFALFICITLSR